VAPDPLVTVVVPVHDIGRFIEPAIRSLVGQSLPAARIEALFVDDGSSDDTPARLARAAAEHRNVRVITIPPSGAPGRPRNLGLAEARGEYVVFLDADDELAPRALEHLTEVAERNQSDVVLGKHASETLTRRQDIFVRNRHRRTLRNTPDLVRASFAANKLFRTAFLREHDITFPEGWRQMEDQLFTLRAYLRAGVISVYADEPCYYFHRRDDEQHISAELPEAAQHVERLGVILETVAREPDLGKLRSRLLAKFYRGEALSRLLDPGFLEAGADYQVALFRGVHGLAGRWVDDDVEGSLGAILGLASKLVRADRLDALLTLGSRLAELEVRARTRRAAWIDGAVRLRFTLGLERADGSSLVVVEEGGRLLLDPALTAGLGVDPIDVTADLTGVRSQLSVVHPESALEWLLPIKTRLDLARADVPAPAGGAVTVPIVRGEAVLDPEAVGPGRRALEVATWAITARWSGLGLSRTGPLAAPRPRGWSLPPRGLGEPARWAIPATDEAGSVHVRVEPVGPELPAFDVGAMRRLPRASSLRVLLPMETSHEGVLGSLDLRAIPLDGGSSEGVSSQGRPLPATLRGRAGRVVLDVAAARGLPPGRYRVRGSTGGAAGADDILTVAVKRAGAAVADLPPLSSGEWLRIRAGWLRTMTKVGLRRAIMTGFARLPRGVRRAIRRVTAAVRG